MCKKGEVGGRIKKDILLISCLSPSPLFISLQEDINLLYHLLLPYLDTSPSPIYLILFKSSKKVKRSKLTISLKAKNYE